MSEPIRFGTEGPSVPRNRYCARCVAIADESMRRGLPAPPTRDVRSWIEHGRRYYGGLCSACGAFERQVRDRLRLERDRRAG